MQLYIAIAHAEITNYSQMSPSLHAACTHQFNSIVHKHNHKNEQLASVEYFSNAVVI